MTPEALAEALTAVNLDGVTIQPSAARSVVVACGSARAFDDARSVLAGAYSALATVTPAPDAPPAILRSEVEGVAMNLACMASSALNPAWTTPTDEALMGVVATLRHALAEIAKENA